MIKKLIPLPLRRLRARYRALDNLDLVARRSELDRLAGQLDLALEAIGRIEARQVAELPGSVAEHEFRVFSHAGEDGIIQFLTNVVPIANRTFVEFGVEDYREANTRFLLVNDHWSGLVMDGNEKHVAKIKADPLYWNETLTAVAAFVTRENINELLRGAGFVGEVGLLSIDVDGNDYWIFDAIDVIRPAIVVCEYNHRFGPSRSVTIPYDAAFVRRQTDGSWLYAGASLAALTKVAEKKGMALVGCNSFGNNAFFVQKGLLPEGLPALTAAEAFVPGRFREYIVRDGNVALAMPEDERRLVRDAVVVEIE